MWSHPNPSATLRHTESTASSACLWCVKITRERRAARQFERFNAELIPELPHDQFLVVTCSSHANWWSTRDAVTKSPDFRASSKEHRKTSMSMRGQAMQILRRATGTRTDKRSGVTPTGEADIAPTSRRGSHRLPVQDRTDLLSGLAPTSRPGSHQRPVRVIAPTSRPSDRTNVPSKIAPTSCQGSRARASSAHRR